MAKIKESYQQLKEAAREAAIDWQNSWQDNWPSYGELAEAQERFEKLGRRYGLIREFRENAII